MADITFCWPTLIVEVSEISISDEVMVRSMAPDFSMSSSARPMSPLNSA